MGGFFFSLSLSLKACGIRGKEGQRFGPVLCQGNVPAIFFQPGQGVLGMASFPGSLHTCSLPPRRSISSSCLRFSELPSLRGISTCLLPELPDHKELTAGKARRTGKQWKHSGGKAMPNGGKTKGENCTERYHGRGAGVLGGTELKRPQKTWI